MIIQDTQCGLQNVRAEIYQKSALGTLSDVTSGKGRAAAGAATECDALADGNLLAFAIRTSRFTRGQQRANHGATNER
jgi:hypothetical protein